MSSTRQSAGATCRSPGEPEPAQLDRTLRVVGLLLRHTEPRRRLSPDWVGCSHAERVRTLEALFAGEPDVRDAGRRSVVEQLQRWAEVRDSGCPRAMAAMLWALARDPRASVRTQRGRFLDEVERLVFTAFARRLEGESIARVGLSRWAGTTVGSARERRTNEGLVRALSSASNRSRTG